jgi:hypothetical protein
MSEKLLDDKIVDCNSDLFSLIFNFLQPKEKEAWIKFKEKHKNHGIHCSGNGITIELTPDSIGGYVIIMKCNCKAKENITDFSCW